MSEQIPPNPGRTRPSSPGRLRIELASIAGFAATWLLANYFFANWQSAPENNQAKPVWGALYFVCVLGGLGAIIKLRERAFAKQRKSSPESVEFIAMQRARSAAFPDIAIAMIAVMAAAPLNLSLLTTNLIVLATFVALAIDVRIRRDRELDRLLGQN